MTTGTVKWFDSKKGFGFIVNDNGQDVFVHYTVIDGEGFRSLKEGEIVSYEPTTGKRGLSAAKVLREAQKRSVGSLKPSFGTALPA
jgi:CspA family cold shock protein